MPISESEIDGQSFMVVNNLGLWDEVISKFLPNSKFLPQSMDNLSEIINSSTIPNFSTNVSRHLRTEFDHIHLPILDKEATVNFYLTYKKSNKPKLKKLINLIK